MSAFSLFQLSHTGLGIHMCRKFFKLNRLQGLTEPHKLKIAALNQPMQMWQSSELQVESSENFTTVLAFEMPILFCFVTILVGKLRFHQGMRNSLSL